MNSRQHTPCFLVESDLDGQTIISNNTQKFCPIIILETGHQPLLCEVRFHSPEIGVPDSDLPMSPTPIGRSRGHRF